MSVHLPFNRHHLQPGDRVCVAVSGGADSTALLLALHAGNAASRNSLGIGLSAAHVHHNLRGLDADADQAFVEKLCAHLEIPLHLHRADVPAHTLATRASAGKSEGLEEAARTLRYSFFHSLLDAGQADTVLTAHTLDDQAETVLMKILRGAWTEGLSAIAPVLQLRKGRILRPLLNTSRAEIEAYLHALNQPWREDDTNQDSAYTRNRIRHHVLPLLRQENPSLDRTLANLAELAREEETHWQLELGRLLPHLLLPGKPTRGGGRATSTNPGESTVAIELDRLRSCEPATRRRVLRAAARTLGARLSFDETARLLTLAGLAPPDAQPLPTLSTGAGSKAAVLQLSHNLRAERSPREIRLSLAAAKPVQVKLQPPPSPTR